ncbi:hypothetical protein M426DRAFT_24754 [Hypoxylon sp. CI-4A]|nr:hypothetical protein M426DRAFT_24754 [Hypoxylon sp. CI-4A]
MPRPIETLDITLPTDHPLKRPVSHRSKQGAQRIYQLWNIWPWQLFSPKSPHHPILWTDNLVDKLKTIALCTTLRHARRLLRAHMVDDQCLSPAVLNAVIDACKEGSDTPHNPTARSKKRKQSRTTAEHHQDEDEQDVKSVQDDLDDDAEEEISVRDRASSQQAMRQAIRSNRQSRRPFSPNNSSRFNSPTNRHSMPPERAMPLFKRAKRQHHSMFTPSSFSENNTSPEFHRASFSASFRSAPQVPPSPLRTNGAASPQSSYDDVATYIESTILQLSNSFQDQRQAAERTIDVARSQYSGAKARLVELENELDAVRKTLVEIELEKAGLESTRVDLLAIEREEEELAERRRALMTRASSVNWRPSSSLSGRGEPRQSVDLQVEIETLVANQLQPQKEREAALEVSIAGIKGEMAAAQTQLDASTVELNASSDKLIRWRGFSNDIQDALIRRGFAEPALLWEFGQKDTDRMSASFVGPPIHFPRVATSAVNIDSSLDDFEVHAASTHADAAATEGTDQLEQDTRLELV